jgi:circadian clock protein KaiC
MVQNKTAKKGSKVPTGIAGFDAITGGGLPRGNVTAVIGGAGSGKTIFGLQFLANGASSRSEAAIFVAFEESSTQIIANAQSFAWSINVRDGKRKGVQFFDAMLSASVVQGGEFDLIGLLAMIEAKAKRSAATLIVLDGVDVLLGHLQDAALVRREIFRLREWLVTNKFTAVITAKADPSDARLSPDYDFLQFMADCVVSMHHRLVDGTALRVLRVLKFRGTAHSANEFPFSISDRGIEIAVVPSGELSYAVSAERVSSGVARLDAMLGGGYYRGSSVLISGAPGTAKTSLAAAFAAAACERRERALYVSFDEGRDQIVRNVGSIGIRLAPHIRARTLFLHSMRARSGSPEAHVARIRSLILEYKPGTLVIDPISALTIGCGDAIAEQAAIQILDIARAEGITTLNTSLLGNELALSEKTPIGISTIADTWIHLSYVSQAGERNRALTIIKSRGTGHSNQVRELILSDAGVTLADVYSSGGSVLMGTLRWQKENEERRSRELTERSAEQAERHAELAVAEMKARMQVLSTELAIRQAELEHVKLQRRAEIAQQTGQHRELIERRGGDEKRGRTSGQHRRAVR